MPPSREDDLSTYVVQLERELHRLRCEYRRTCEALDWAEEQVRVMRRVITKLVTKEQP